MYINDGLTITNTPTAKAAYNTWQYQANPKSWYQHVPSYYTDNNGQIHEIIKWGNACYKVLPGGMYKGTPTRTGGWYQKNYIQIPCDQDN